jgi:hypothetical protein
VPMCTFFGLECLYEYVGLDCMCDIGLERIDVD